MTLTTRHSYRKSTLTMLLAAVVGTVMMMLALAHAQDTSTAQTNQAVSEIKTAKADTLGDYLTDANGRALYLFLVDTSKMSNCTDACATTWPPVLVSDASDLPKIAEGMDQSLLGTVERGDGTVQLTYNGWPLYYYAGDVATSDVNGQGLNDKWYLVTLEGMGTSITAGELGGGPAPEATAQ